MVMLFGLGVSSTVGVYAMLPLYLVTERHIEPTWANTIVALSRSHGPILGLLGGWASDRLGAKQTIVISLVFTGVMTLLLGLAFGRAAERCGVGAAAAGGLVFSGGLRGDRDDHAAERAQSRRGVFRAVRVFDRRRRDPDIYRRHGRRRFFAIGFTMTGVLISAGGCWRFYSSCRGERRKR